MAGPQHGALTGLCIRLRSAQSRTRIEAAMHLATEILLFAARSPLESP